jgi:hypothetical protein
MTSQRAAKSPRRRYELAPRKRTRRGWVRRFNALASDFAADLGAGALSNADRAMVRAAAGLVVRTEQSQAAMLAGEPTDENTVVRLSNSVTRILTALGAKQTKRPTRPYGLADIQAALAADDDEDEAP